MVQEVKTELSLVTELCFHSTEKKQLQEVHEEFLLGFHLETQPQRDHASQKRKRGSKKPLQ